MNIDHCPNGKSCTHHPNHIDKKSEFCLTLTHINHKMLIYFIIDIIVYLKHV